MPTDPGEITALLGRWAQGDAEAFASLVSLAYDDLRRIAHRRLLASGRGGTLSTTALVHELYLRLVQREGSGDWPSRAQFYSFVSRAMRHILVDRARRDQADRRGGQQVRIPLEEETPDEAGPVDVLGVDEAVTRLAERHPRMAQVVELRFFGGLTVPEVADVLQTSVRTVERDWTRARAYLLESLQAEC